MSKDVSIKNVERYPNVEVGTEIVILDAKMPVLNGRIGTVIEAPATERSPHKSMYKVNVTGRGGPWYVFRTEFQPIATREGQANAGSRNQ